MHYDLPDFINRLEQFRNGIDSDDDLIRAVFVLNIFFYMTRCGQWSISDCYVRELQTVATLVEKRILGTLFVD